MQHHQIGKVEISVFEAPQIQQEDEFNDPSVFHKEMITDMVNISSVHKYVTCSRDGSLRVWAAKTLNHIQTVKVSDKSKPGSIPWVTNATEAHGLQSSTYPFGVLAVMATDKQMRLYDIKSFALLNSISLPEDVSPLCCTGFMRKDVLRRMKNSSSDYFIAIGDADGKIIIYEQVKTRCTP
jgi:WD40 repeat protein